MLRRQAELGVSANVNDPAYLHMALHRVFEGLGINKEGNLTAKTLSDVLEKQLDMHISRKEVRHLIRSIDTDNSGLIDYAEFIQASGQLAVGI